jgi:hypothetical protein
MPRHDQPHPVPTPEQAEKLQSLPHRVQSAIAFLQGHHELEGTRFPECEPKHLRVGVNSALIETSAVARLLFRKGVITAEEYYDTVIEVWEEEIDSYRKDLKDINPGLEI